MPKYKKIKIVLGILTFERNDLLKITLASCYDNLISKDIFSDIILFDNGSSNKQKELNSQVAKYYNITYIHTGTIKHELLDLHEREKQMQNGYSQIFKLLLNRDADIFLFLEDDWECIASAPISLFAYKLLNSKYGQLRLRNCEYDSSAEGYSETNFVTIETIRWDNTFYVSGYYIRSGNLHWTTNPSLVKMEALAKLKTPIFNNEIEQMQHFHNYYPYNMQLFPGIFKHIGPIRDRPDLEDMGLIPSSS